MRKIWTSGAHIHQEINGESQRVRVAIEHLSSEIPSIGGPHDIWVHSSDYEKLQEENKILREALEKISTDTVDVGFYVEPTWSAQIAREALAKVKE